MRKTASSTTRQRTELFYDADGSGGGSACSYRQASTRRVAYRYRHRGDERRATPPPPPPPTGGGTGQVFTGTSASETITGGAGDDTLQGLGSADSLVGGGGNDWLEGGTGQDRLNGGTGADRFVFKDPLASVNWDYVNDFVSGTDKLVFDDAIFTSLGGPGSFAAGDERFVAAPGARYGVEPDDRLMYDTGTGKLYYDPDGSGAGSAYIVGVLQGAPALAATDITVIWTAAGATRALGAFRGWGTGPGGRVQYGPAVRALVARLRPFFLYAGLFSLVINLLLLVPPLYMLQVFDRVLWRAAAPRRWLVLSVAAVVALLIMAILDVLRARLLAPRGGARPHARSERDRRPACADRQAQQRGASQWLARREHAAQLLSAARG